MKGFTEISRSLSLIRIIAGFVFAPFLGLFLYFSAISFRPPFSFDRFISTISISIVHFFSVSAIANPFFYPLAMILGTIVLLLLMRYYSYGLGICMIGSLTNGILASMLFFIILLLSGTTFTHAFAGFVLLLSMIAVPSILAGILFWFIVAFKNTSLATSLE